ncbi:hypothetical protein KEM52_001406 [Ascosphaera acerosa]|nr:hypothetical protein KEM52_001406 [Ascosphaera acerosa]
MQVAETFTAEFSNAMLDMKETDHQALGDDLKILAEIVELGGLQNLAKLDTCVTVVDAFNLLNDFDTADFLSDRFGREGVEPEDERTISDLMTDQIEFADVIIINKIETVDESMRARIRQIAQLLNPGAKVIETSYAQVDVKEIVNTGRFDFLKAASGAGWLKSLHESMVRVTPHGNVLTPKPETIEYGINTFVYQNRRPFHPRRLFALLHDKFIILQNGENQDEDGATDDDDANVIDDNATSGSAGSSDDGTEQDDDETCQEFEQPDPKTVLWNKRKTPFGSVFRSKGFFWLATRPMQMGEWSQAGSMLTIGSGGPWFAEVPREAWPDDADIINSIEQDFDGTWGDRRQEIVFIGEKMDVQGICNMLDGCLLTSQEWDQWETIMSKPHPSMREKTMMLDKLWEDGWEPWSSIMIEVEVDEDGAGDRVATSADAPGPTHRISVPGHAGHLHVHNGQQRP